MSDEKLLSVALPHQGTFSQELSHLFWRIELPDEYTPMYLGAKSTDIATARNSLIKASMEEENVEWILQIDSDQSVEPSVPRRMIKTARENDIKILSALTFVWRNGLPLPLLPRDEDDGYTFNWLETTGLIEADRVGTGCLLVHRSVFEELDKPYFMQTYDDEGIRKEAEDYRFSRKAKEAGIQPHIASDIVVGHIKRIDLRDIVNLLDFAISVNSEEEFLRGF